MGRSLKGILFAAKFRAVKNVSTAEESGNRKHRILQLEKGTTAAVRVGEGGGWEGDHQRRMRDVNFTLSSGHKLVRPGDFFPLRCSRSLPTTVLPSSNLAGGDEKNQHAQQSIPCDDCAWVEAFIGSRIS